MLFRDSGSGRGRVKGELVEEGITGWVSEDNALFWCSLEKFGV